MTRTYGHPKGAKQLGLELPMECPAGEPLAFLTNTLTGVLLEGCDCHGYRPVSRRHGLPDHRDRAQADRGCKPRACRDCGKALVRCQSLRCREHMLAEVSRKRRQAWADWRRAHVAAPLPR